jgi:VWFA-related protein
MAAAACLTRFDMFRPVAVLSLAAIGVAVVSASQEPRFRSGTPAVPVYATVLDRDGRLVTDLQKEDFEVFDDGKRQDLTVFANDIQPITVVMMLDRSGSMVANYELVRDAAQEFVTNLLPFDRVRLGSFSNRVQIDPEEFTGDRQTLNRILRDKLLGPGTTPLWNATWAAMTALSREQGRRVVLLFTDGIDTPDWRGQNSSFTQVRDRAAAEGIMVYAIGFASGCAPAQRAVPSWPGQPRFDQRIPGRGGRFPPIGRPPVGMPPIGRDPIGRGPVEGTLPRPGEPRGGGDTSYIRPCQATRPDPDLRELAAVSGGGYFELSSGANLGGTFARVADELHQQYLLAFAPAALDGRSHALEVRVASANLTVRARKGYLAVAEP